MRAIRQRALGGPDVLEPTTMPRPEPGPTEVRVRVAAAAVNPVDWKTRAGQAVPGGKRPEAESLRGSRAPDRIIRGRGSAV